MNPTIGVSKTTNNVTKLKSNNTTSPKTWITNVKQLIGSINLFIPTNQAKNNILNSSILKNNGSIDIPKIKINLDKINNKLNLIKKFSESIDNYINTQPNLIYPKPTSNFNQNNIDSLRQNVEKRLATLKQLKESLTTYNTSINANKIAFIKSITEKINKFINDKYISALNIKKQELTGINTKITDLVNTIKEKLGKNIPINKNYTTLNNIQLNKNNTLKINLTTLKQSLDNSLKNITINTSSANQAFINYNQLYNKININLKNKHANINKSISNRITKLSDNIITKTAALNTLMESINTKITDLQGIINGNTNVFSQEQKLALNGIIGQLSESVKGSTTNFTAENDKLKAIVASLKILIGTKNNVNKMNNANIRTSLSNKIDNNAQVIRTNIKNKSNLNNQKNNIIAKTNTINNITATTTANTAIVNKKIKNLTNNNKKKSFTYKTKRGNIKATYIGKNNQGRIQLKNKSSNGKTNHIQSIGQNATTILNKSIVFNA
jgi:hypothetical protein